MSLVGQGLLGRWRTLYGRRGKKWSQNVTRRKTPGLDSADQVKYIVRSLFPHVEPFQRQDRSSCVIRGEELFTLDELKRAGGRLKANTAPGIDGLPNEILKEFFSDWKKQRLVLLRKGNKPAGNRSREGGQPQGWKAQTRREMADEMAW